MKKLLEYLGSGRKGDALPTLSAKEALILRLLLDRGRRERYGLELVETSDGELKRGTVYVTLGRMEEKGFVESRQEERPSHEGGLPRRLYQATGHGARVLAAWEAVAARLRLEPVR